MDKEKKSKDVVFAIFLIFIGTIFLLNSTGVVGWGIWQNILRFWPIFLILAGVKLIFEKSAVAEIIIGILALLLFTSVAIFSYISYTSQSLPFVPRTISRYIKENPELFSVDSVETIEEEERISLEDYDIEDVEERTLKIDVGATKFTVTDDVELENYLNLDSSFSNSFVQPSLESKLENGLLDLSFKTRPAARFVFWGSTHSSEFNLTLGQTQIQTDVDINLGAGRGEVLLESTNLRNISSSVGAGRLDVSLNGDAIPESFEIELGAGKMTITIPENVGYELSYDLGVGRILVNKESIADFVGEETSLRSANYEEAEHIIIIEAKVGVGSLEIIQK